MNKGAHSKLEAAVAELRGLVEIEMKARHDRPGALIRDVMSARVLAANPKLLANIEALASSDDVHKAAPLEVGQKSAMSVVIEHEVETRAHELVAEGRALNMVKARSQAWKEDPARRAAYDFPGTESVGKAAFSAARSKIAADAALASISKILSPDDAVLGHRLANSNFPRLSAAARGLRVS